MTSRTFCGFPGKENFMLFALLCFFRTFQDSNGLTCTQQGLVVDRDHLRVDDKFCCMNRAGHYVIGEKKQHKCCVGSENPLYNGDAQMCNGTDVIRSQPHLTQCKHNRVCVRGSRSKSPKKDVPLHPKIIPVKSVVTEMPPTANVPDVACNAFDEGCCEGFKLTKRYLCHRNMRVRKRHPLHDSVCGIQSLTYQKGNETCYGNSLLPGTNWCGNKQIVSNSLCCGGSLAKNVIGCCGARGMKKGRICCGASIYRIKKGFKCIHNQYKKTKKVKPIQSFFFQVEKKLNKMNSNTCSYEGKLLIPSAAMKLNKPRAIKSEFQIVITPCKKLKAGKWYNILSKKLVTENDTQLRVKYTKAISRMPKKFDKHLTEYCESIIRSKKQ